MEKQSITLFLIRRLHYITIAEKLEKSVFFVEEIKFGPAPDITISL
jgi:hypothetical protein